MFGILIFSMSLVIAAPYLSTNIIKQLFLSIIILRFIENYCINSRINSVLQFSMNSNILIIAIIGILLELLSIGFRSISLGFRIFANISAGHVLGDILSVLKYLVITKHIEIIFSILHIIFFFIYEISVVCIQIGVYSALIQVYIGI